MSDVESKEYLISLNLATRNNVPEIIDLTLDASDDEEEGNRDKLDIPGMYSGENVQMITEEDPLENVAVIKVVSFIEVDSDDETVTMVTEGGEELADNPETGSRFCMNSKNEPQSVCDSGSTPNMLHTELPDPVRNGTSRPFDMNMPVLKKDMFCMLPNGSAERDIPLLPAADLMMQSDQAEPSMKLSDPSDMSDVLGEQTKMWNDDGSEVRQVPQKVSPAGSHPPKPKRMKFTKALSKKSCHPGKGVPEVLPLGFAQQNVSKELRDKYIDTNTEIQQTEKQKLSKTMSRNSPNVGSSVSEGSDLETHQHPQQQNMEAWSDKSTESDAETNKNRQTYEQTQMKYIQQDERKVQSSSGTSSLCQITCPSSALCKVDEPVQHLMTYDTVCYKKLQATDVQDIGYFCDKCSMLFSHGSQYRAHMTYQGQCSGSSDVRTNEAPHCGCGSFAQRKEIQKTCRQPDSVSCALFEEGDNGQCKMGKSHHCGVFDGHSICLYDKVLQGSQEKHGILELGSETTSGKNAFKSTKKVSANEQVMSFSKPLGNGRKKRKAQTTKVLPEVEVEVEQKKYQLRPRTQVSFTRTALKKDVGEKMHQPQSKTPRTQGTDVEEDFASRRTLFYVCGSNCGYTTLFYRSFKMHVDECLLFESLSCIHCGFKGMAVEDLTSHMEAHLEQYDKRFRCMEESCVFHTNILKLLKVHLVDGHKGLSSFRCCVCETVCEDLGSLVQHLEDNLVQVVWCRYCDAVACDLEVILKHGQEAHPGKEGLWTMDRLLCADRKRNGAMETYPGVAALEPFQGRLVETASKNADLSVKDVRVCETKEHFSLDSTNEGAAQVCFNEEFFSDMLSSHTGHLSDDANIFRSDIPSQQISHKEVDNNVAEESEIESEVNIRLSPDASYLIGTICGMQYTNESVTSAESGCRHAGTSVTSTESGCRHAATSVASTESGCRHDATSVTSTESGCKHAGTSVTSTESGCKHAGTSATSTESDDGHEVTSVTSTEDNYRNASKSVISTDVEGDLACKDDVIDASGSMEKGSFHLIRGNKQRKTRKTVTVPDGEYFTKALKCIACVFSSMSRKNFVRHLKSCHPEIHVVMESSGSQSLLEVKQYEREKESLDEALLWLYEDHDTCYMCCICKRVICVKIVLHCHLLGHLKVNLGHCMLCDEITCLKPEHRKKILVKTPGYIVEETKRSVQVLLGSVEQNGVPVCNLKPCLGTEELREKLDHLNTFCRKRFHCSVCLSSHASLYSIHKHILLKHLNMPPFTCGVCDFSGSGRYEVARHMHSKHPFEPLCLRYSPLDDSCHILFDVPGKRLHRKEYVLVGPNGSHRTLADRFLEHRRWKRMIIGGKDRGSERRVIGVSQYRKTRQGRHKRTGHSGNGNNVLGEHQCSCCSFRTRLLKLLIEHKKECHPLVEILNEDTEEEISGWCGKMEVELSEAGCKSLVDGGPMDTHVKTFYRCQYMQLQI